MDLRLRLKICYVQRS